MKKNRKKILCSILLVIAVSIIPLGIASAKQNEKGKYPREVYAELFSEEVADYYVNNRDEAVDGTLDVIELEHKKLQEFMTAHPDLTEEEIAYHSERLLREARMEVAGSERAQKEIDSYSEWIANARAYMPVITDSDSEEEKAEKRSIQRKYHLDILDSQMRIIQLEKDPDNYDPASPKVDELLVQLNEMMEHSTISDDGKTYTVSPDYALTPELEEILNRL